MRDPCIGCGYDLALCRELWPEQRKCCPDCEHPHVHEYRCSCGSMGSDPQRSPEGESCPFGDRPAVTDDPDYYPSTEYERGYADGRLADPHVAALEAARAVVDAWIDDESGMETFDPVCIDRLAAALDGSMSQAQRSPTGEQNARSGV